MLFCRKRERERQTEREREREKERERERERYRERDREREREREREIMFGFHMFDFSKCQNVQISKMCKKSKCPKCQPPPGGASGGKIRNFLTILIYVIHAL
jgi:hypothetical protein